MKYLLTCLLLTISIHSLHCMQEGEDKKDQHKSDFNYIPPDAPKQKGMWLSNEDFPKVLAATPRVCVDVILLRINEKTGKLEYFIVKRKNRPAKGFWWLPGGGMNPCEEIFDAAERKCNVEGGLLAASFRTVNFFRTRFPDSDHDHPLTRQMLRTDSFNFVVIAFYDPESPRTDLYEDAEAVQWVDFDRLPSSLPMPSEQERQGVDVAYLDEAHRQAHDILDPQRENISSLIDQTLIERRLLREAQTITANQPEPHEEDQELRQFSFDEELTSQPNAQARQNATPSPHAAEVTSPRAIRPASPTPPVQARISLRQSPAGQGSPRVVSQNYSSPTWSSGRNRGIDPALLFDRLTDQNASGQNAGEKSN